MARNAAKTSASGLRGRGDGRDDALVIVSDNGPGYKSDAFARFIGATPYLAHVRTKFRSPQTNGVIERFFQSIKYEHLYRHDISNAVDLSRRSRGSATCITLRGRMRKLGQIQPMQAYLSPPGQPFPRLP